MADLIVATERGLYCEAGRFHIDPWLPVERAIITHAHSDHARFGSRHYYSSEDGAALLRRRWGETVSVESFPFGRPLERKGGVRVRLQPAGNLRGWAEVRIGQGGEVWGVSGD